jgi:hypothetical protein
MCFFIPFFDFVFVGEMSAMNIKLYHTKKICVTDLISIVLSDSKVTSLRMSLLIDPRKVILVREL